jgi:RNA polymerase sigma-70 factor, ECF subfamily
VRGAIDQLSTHETIQQVHAAIRQLSQKDRELIVLRYLEEQPIDDIAQTLGLSRGAVNVRLNRARSRLETILKPLFET